jgi:hypothetical protein
MKISVHCVAILAGCCLLIAYDQAECVAADARDDWGAIENCLSILRQCQLDDGLIRMKSDSKSVWAVPYSGNFAAMAFLAANQLHPNPEDVRRVERWMSWYADHQEQDGTIFDQVGKVSSYRSRGQHDSTDAYAATFLMTAWRYQQATRRRPDEKIIRAAKLALRAIADVQQPNGLTIAQPTHPILYLMDNIEVYGGLVEGASFFESQDDQEDARKARGMSGRVAAGLAGYWSPKEGCFAMAKDVRGKCMTGLEKPYPHGLAQLYGLAHVEPRRGELWQEVRRRFKPGDAGMPEEHWLIAAIRCASADELQELRQATRAAMLRFTPQSVYVDRPSMAILAMIDGKARFPALPLSTLPPKD